MKPKSMAEDSETIAKAAKAAPKLKCIVAKRRENQGTSVLYGANECMGKRAARISTDTTEGLIIDEMPSYFVHLR